MANWITRQFITSLNQPKGLPNGRYRRSSPPVYGNPTDRTGAGSRGSGLPRRAFPALVSIPSFSFTPSIPYAGVRTGEIIGERFWVVRRNGLYSIAHYFKWEPGETIVGDIQEIVGLRLLLPIYGGVYAYNPSSLQYHIESEAISKAQFTMNDRFDEILGVAAGKVKLWGEVVEHEHGYRAQFAKMISVTEITKRKNHSILQPYLKAIHAQTHSLPRS